MDKKGFTLIELLAVIVILAIIALIATPIVLNIIKDTRESAGLRSAEMYLETVEQAVSIEKMNNTKFNPSTCTIKEDGNLTCEGTDVQVEVKGEKPLKGNIIFQSGKIINIRLEYKNNKIILKNEKGNLEYFDYDRNSDINFIVEGIKEQKTTTGKNLWALGDITFTQGKGDIKLSSPLSAGTYTFSGNVTSSDTDAETCLLLLTPNNQGVGIKRGNGVSVTFTTAFDISGIRLYASNNNDNSVGDTATFTDIQIEAGEVATEYEEYTGGKPSPSPEYPQDIPLGGTLNTKTGKYDISVTALNEDGTKSKSLTLTSPVQLTKWDKLVKKDGLWGWSIFNREKIFDGTVGCTIYDKTDVRTICSIVLNDKPKGRSNIVCSHYRLYTKTNAWQSSELLNAMSGTNGVNTAYFNVSPEITTSNDWKDFTSQNPIKVIYETSVEQSFHPLPDDEQNLLYNLKL